MTERLNKVLARAGVASRRAADRLIAEGRVSVNGRIVSQLGTRVDPERDAVKVDGRRVRLTPPEGVAHAYWMLNKPRGYVTTLSDPEGRPTIRDLLKRVRGPRLFPVGRLDYHSEGLLLLTDDGELARGLMHPSSGVSKTYLAKVRGVPDAAALQRLSRGGLALDGRRTLPASVEVVRRDRHCWLQLAIVEGRRRQVRRMLAAVGHPVLRLRRVRYDGVELGKLPAGALRPLTGAEVKRLRRAVERGDPAGRATRPN